MANEKQIDNLVELLDGYAEKGGHHLNVNVLNRETLLDAQQRSVEVHVVDLKLQTQLLSNGLCGVHVDALERTGVGGHLIRREGSVGGHGQLAGLNGGQLSSSAGRSCLGGSSGRACGRRSGAGRGTTAGGQSQSGSGQTSGSQEAATGNLFHIQTLLDRLYNLSSLCGDAIHRNIRERV